MVAHKTRIHLGTCGSEPARDKGLTFSIHGA